MSVIFPLAAHAAAKLQRDISGVYEKPVYEIEQATYIKYRITIEKCSTDSYCVLDGPSKIWEIGRVFATFSNDPSYGHNYEMLQLEEMLDELKDKVPEIVKEDVE